MTVPVIIAFVESARLRSGPWDVGFWGLARSVGGTCHVPWRRRGTPVIRFELPDGRARLRVVKLPGWQRWRVEVRAYQESHFGFTARLTSPQTDPVRWRTPGLEPLDVFPEEEQYMVDFGFETTDEHLLRWLLRHQKLRKTLASFK